MTRWINTKVISREIAPGVWQDEHVEGFEYDGPLALAKNFPNTVQNHFRFRSDTGTVDATPTWSAGEDTNISVDASAGDVTLRLRVLLQETGGAAEDAQTYELRTSLDSYAAAITTSSTNGIFAADAGSSADGTNISTPRLTGSGSFVTGEYDETGTTDSITLTASNYTEVEFGITVDASALSDGDVIDFRVYGTTNGALDSYAITPRITVRKSTGAGTHKNSSGAYFSSAATSHSPQAITVDSGDLLVVIAGGQTTSIPTGCSDTLSNTWTAFNAGATVGGVVAVRGWYAIASSSGETKVTVTISSSVLGVYLDAFEGPLNGIDANPALDTTSTSTPYTCPATGTLAQADELVIGYLQNRGSTVASVSSPFSQAQNFTNGTGAASNQGALAYQVVASTSSTSATIAGNNSNAITGTASFKLSGGGGDGAGSAVAQSTASATGALTNSQPGSAVADASASATGDGQTSLVGSADGDASASAGGDFIQIQEGAGSAVADSTASATGSSFFDGSGAADADATASGTGESTADSTAAADADATASAASSSFFDAVASADGDSTAASTGDGQTSLVGAADADATASAASNSFFDGAGAADADATASAVGQDATAGSQGAGSADGDASASATSNNFFDGVGAANADATASATIAGDTSLVGAADGDATAKAILVNLTGGDTAFQIDAFQHDGFQAGHVGEAAGDATAAAAGDTFFSGVGSATGTAAASAVGSSFFDGVGSADADATASGVAGGEATDAVGAASGTSSATAVGEDGATEAVAAASGTSTASATSNSFFDGVGAADAEADASAVGVEVQSAGVGEADGQAEALGVGVGINSAGAGTADGSADATGVGVAIQSAGAGSADAEASAAGIGASFYSVAGSATSTSTADGIGFRTIAGGGSQTALGYNVQKPRSKTTIGLGATQTSQSRRASHTDLGGRGSKTVIQRPRVKTEVGDF